MYISIEIIHTHLTSLAQHTTLDQGQRDPLNNMELRRPADRKLIPNNQLRSQIRHLVTIRVDTGFIGVPLIYLDGCFSI